MGALGYVGLVDPHKPDSVFPVCPFRLLTGWNCPACGGLRMVHDVLDGDLTAAITDNAFLLVGIRCWPDGSCYAAAPENRCFPYRRWRLS